MRTWAMICHALSIERLVHNLGIISSMHVREQDKSIMYHNQIKSISQSIDQSHMWGPHQSSFIFINQREREGGRGKGSEEEEEEYLLQWRKNHRPHSRHPRNPLRILSSSFRFHSIQLPLIVSLYIR